jgi:hypothetical protein
MFEPAASATTLNLSGFSATISSVYKSIHGKMIHQIIRDNRKSNIPGLNNQTPFLSSIQLPQKTTQIHFKERTAVLKTQNQTVVPEFQLNQCIQQWRLV